MSLLEKVNCPNDIKKLNDTELNNLATEIRSFLIKSCSKTGGHVGPNLGTIELTLALHKVFNSPKDKFVWDVGHQCYTHKIITGRQKKFDTLRQYNGLSGFPKQSESDHDHFHVGHASTSISTALGIAEARDIKKENFDVVAIIGDGSLNGGLAFEGLNNIGYLQANVTIVLNDNKMSIAPNVGALSNHLKTLHKISSVSTKDKPRRQIQTIFEELGFKYFGPIDGHNITELNKIFEKSKKIKGPKLIHVLTTKGKGYKPAETLQTEKFHGLGAFNLSDGATQPGGTSFSKIFGDTLVELAEKDKDIVAITAAMPMGTGLSEFAQKFPERFYDVGIAEEHAVTFSSGLASQGIKPCVAIYSTFLQRGFDEIIHDVALQKLPVKFFLDRAGLVDDGPTHHGVFDISFLRIVPDMVIMAAKDENEMRHMIKTAIDYDKGPISLRYPRGKVNGVKMDKQLKTIPIGKSELLRKGNDVTILAIGNMVCEAQKATDALEKEKIDVELINARFAKPLDEKQIIESVKKTGKLITVEENSIVAGFGSAVLELLQKNKINIDVEIIAVADEFAGHGNQKLLREDSGLTAAGIFYKTKYLTKCKAKNLVCNEDCKIKNLCKVFE